MKPQIQHVFRAGTLLVVSVFVGAASAVVPSSTPEQVAPPSVSSPAGSTPRPVLTSEQRGDIFMARKNYADAADYYYRGLQQSNFKNAALWNKLGIVFQAQGNFNKALKAYTSATRVDKKFPEAWNNLGTIYYLGKKYGKSVKNYQRAIAIENNVATFHLNLGISYSHLKKYDRAMEEYRTALGIDPNVMGQDSMTGTVVYAGETDVEYYFYMAKAFASVGNADSAVRYLRRALEDGFKNWKRINDDPDLKKLGQYPAFVELLRNPPVAIKN